MSALCVLHLKVRSKFNCLPPTDRQMDLFALSSEKWIGVEIGMKVLLKDSIICSDKARATRDQSECDDGQGSLIITI